jgi:Predicted oxidoreductases (related to aryl-alcohol dehydrogenases)
VLRLFLGVTAALISNSLPSSAKSGSILKRKIPSSGQSIPAVGLGTARTFDVGPGEPREPLKEVLRLFVETGGAVVDTSPMYGTAETVIGDLATGLGSSGLPVSRYKSLDLRSGGWYQTDGNFYEAASHGSYRPDAGP